MYFSSSPRKRLTGIWARYSVALVCLGLALLLVLLEDQIGAATPFLVAASLVALVAWYAGFLPGILTAVLLAVVLALFIVPPFAPPLNENKQVRLAIYLVFSALIAVVLHRHRRASEALRRSEARFRATYEHAAVGLEQLTLDGRLVEVNPKLCEILGYSREELLQRHYSEITHPEDLPAEERHLAALLAGDTPSYALEKRYVRKSGESVWVRLTSSLAGEPGSRDAHRVSVVEDISEQRLAQERERRLYHEVQEADRQKEAFLAMLGHELRTPIGVIFNTVNILERRYATDETLERLRSRIQRQAVRMARLIDDMQDVTRINRGLIVLVRADLDLCRLVRETVEDQRGGIEEAGLGVVLHVPSRPFPVYVDATRLAQVVVNLLNNALKFTDPGGTITVRLDEDGTGARVSVCDTGIGIAPETLPRVFDSFTQGERSLDRSRGGLGLGLALVKGLVELHGGEVSGSSPGLGQGAEFAFRLPRADVARNALTSEGPSIAAMREKELAPPAAEVAAATMKEP